MKFRIKSLEERIVLDAEIAQEINLAEMFSEEIDSSMLDDQMTTVSPEINEIDQGVSSLSSYRSLSDRIVLISNQVEDYEHFEASVLPGVEALHYSSQGEVFESIIDSLSQQLGEQKVESIALVNHAKAGSFSLSEDFEVNIETVEDSDFQSFWNTLGEFLTEEGRLDLLGCNIAQSEEGRELISRLEELGGFEVAASEDLTGNAINGADWILEYGDIDLSNVYFSEPNLLTWEGLLEGTVDDQESIIIYVSGFDSLQDGFYQLEDSQLTNLDTEVSVTLNSNDYDSLLIYLNGNPDSYIEEVFEVTVDSTDSGNQYFMNGSREVLELQRGKTYVFNQSDISNNHPLKFSTTNNRIENISEDNITSFEGYIIIHVDSTLPALYYYCEYHSSMGVNEIRLIDIADDGVDDDLSTSEGTVDNVEPSTPEFPLLDKSDGNVIISISEILEVINDLGLTETELESLDISGDVDAFSLTEDGVVLSDSAILTGQTSYFIQIGYSDENGGFQGVDILITDNVEPSTPEFPLLDKSDGNVIISISEILEVINDLGLTETELESLDISGDVDAFSLTEDGVVLSDSAILTGQTSYFIQIGYSDENGGFQGVDILITDNVEPSTPEFPLLDKSDGNVIISISEILEVINDLGLTETELESLDISGDVDAFSLTEDGVVLSDSAILTGQTSYFIQIGYSDENGGFQGVDILIIDNVEPSTPEFPLLDKSDGNVIISISEILEVINDLGLTETELESLDISGDVDAFSLTEDGVVLSDSAILTGQTSYFIQIGYSDENGGFQGVDILITDNVEPSTPEFPLLDKSDGNVIISISEILEVINDLGLTETELESLDISGDVDAFSLTEDGVVLSDSAILTGQTSYFIQIGYSDENGGFQGVDILITDNVEPSTPEFPLLDKSDGNVIISISEILEVINDLGLTETELESLDISGDVDAFSLTEDGVVLSDSAILTGQTSYFIQIGYSDENGGFQGVDILITDNVEPSTPEFPLLDKSDGNVIISISEILEVINDLGLTETELESLDISGDVDAFSLTEDGVVLSDSAILTGQTSYFIQIGYSDENGGFQGVDILITDNVEPFFPEFPLLDKSDGNVIISISEILEVINELGLTETELESLDISGDVDAFSLTEDGVVLSDSAILTGQTSYFIQIGYSDENGGFQGVDILITDNVEPSTPEFPLLDKSDGNVIISISEILEVINDLGLTETELESLDISGDVDAFSLTEDGVVLSDSAILTGQTSYSIQIGYSDENGGFQGVDILITDNVEPFFPEFPLLDKSDGNVIISISEILEVINDLGLTETELESLDISGDVDAFSLTEDGVVLSDSAILTGQTSYSIQIGYSDENGGFQGVDILITDNVEPFFPEFPLLDKSDGNVIISISEILEVINELGLTETELESLDISGDVDAFSLTEAGVVLSDSAILTGQSSYSIQIGYSDENGDFQGVDILITDNVEPFSPEFPLLDKSDGNVIISISEILEVINELGLTETELESLDISGDVDAFSLTEAGVVLSDSAILTGQSSYFIQIGYSDENGDFQGVDILITDNVEPFFPEFPLLDKSDGNVIISISEILEVINELGLTETELESLDISGDVDAFFFNRSWSSTF